MQITEIELVRIIDEVLKRVELIQLHHSEWSNGVPEWQIGFKSGEFYPLLRGLQENVNETI